MIRGAAIAENFAIFGRLNDADLGCIQLAADEVNLADEQKLAELFPDCELGAEPPIGRLYNLPTIMDESLTADARVTFQAGTHCAEPLMHRFGLESTARASFAIYTTHDEIDFLADTLTRVREFFT